MKRRDRTINRLFPIPALRRRFFLLRFFAAPITVVIITRRRLRYFPIGMRLYVAVNFGNFFSLIRNRTYLFSVLLRFALRIRLRSASRGAAFYVAEHVSAGRTMRRTVYNKEYNDKIYNLRRAKYSDKDGVKRNRKRFVSFR